MAQLGELKTWGHNICYGNFILNYIGMICQKSGFIPSLKTYAQGFDSLRRKKDFGVKKLHVSEIVNSKGGGRLLVMLITQNNNSRHLCPIYLQVNLSDRAGIRKFSLSPRSQLASNHLVLNRNYFCFTYF